MKRREFITRIRMQFDICIWHFSDVDVGQCYRRGSRQLTS
jgi:hypothetical protein